MSIKVNPFRSIQTLGFLPKNDKPQVKSESKTNSKIEFSSASNLHLFAGNLKKTQLFEKLENLNKINNKPNVASAFSPSPIKFGDDDDDIIKETKRILDNYKRKIEPKEIKGSQPAEGGKTSGHADPKHGVKPEVQAEIMNNPERIFSGKNKNGRYVDIYYKDGSAVITEQGNKSKVITAYGKVATKGKAKPFKIQNIIDNPNYVEIKLEKAGSTNVVYPNKERFKANDFPPGPLKDNNNPKINGVNSNPNEPNPIKPTAKPNVQAPNELPITPKTETVVEPPITPKTPIVNEPAVVPETPVITEDLPTPASPIGKLSGVINRGLIIMQLVQIGVAALNYAKLEKDAEKFGFYIDPFLDTYVITDPDKAAKNLGEGFKLTFYTDPNDYARQGQSVEFTVKDGKFTNPNGWQLVFNKDKGYTEAVLLA
jgi:hypothetical protein